ncbi:DNA mismatch endonuclease (patch repair protein) [Rhodovulum sulfidophilum]|uniref:very short patch repair endonuclease n=1 Tax=Rhodovulum sulfidophilum TaxID=35806 RepID=UPI0009082F1D|nr:DNA mismatch endonuclease Vsr [Rhodovulum sulfidophilum]MCW2303239.1 DNA mismatch endonuclease (patch repair protein) [Rhodovulum sulfidophilum]
MADVHDNKTRSRNMAAIRGADTKPEMLIRRGLHASGFRYRLHDRKLPGKPDIVLPKHCSVIFVNGCFWHGHDCPLFRWPATRQEFWRAKITGNMERDARNIGMLLASGWRVATVWECALKGRGRLSPEAVIDSLSRWICSGDQRLNLEGLHTETGGLI